MSHLYDQTRSNTWTQPNTFSAAAVFNSTADFSGIASFSSGLKLSYVAKTATYLITTSNYTIDCTSGTFTVTLPTAVGTSGVGQVYNLKNSGTGVITIATTSSQTIDGQASGEITLAQYDNLTVQSNNANWIIL